MHREGDLEKLQLIELVNSGEIAVIPIGFRCYTVENIRRKLGINQVSLPFNNGFFSPDSVASVFIKPNVDLQDDDGLSHQVCIKTEQYQDATYGLGIKFEPTSYQQIDLLLNAKPKQTIDPYLDASLAYYTLDLRHQFVLAHYNWHQRAKPSNHHSRTQILAKLNDMLNRRIERMLEMCEKAEHIFFIYDETEGYQFLQLADRFYDLTDYSTLETVLANIYHPKYSLLALSDSSALDLVKFCK